MFGETRITHDRSANPTVRINASISGRTVAVRVLRRYEQQQAADERWIDVR